MLNQDLKYIEYAAIDEFKSKYLYHQLTSTANELILQKLHKISK